jgi:hypothetical protein
MAVSKLNPVTGGGIKAVQRGSAASAGTVTITAVDINKAFVNVFGTASSGTVAATGAVSATNGATAASTSNLRNSNYTTNTGFDSGSSTPISNPATNIAMNAANLSGGTNNLVAAVVQGYLSNSTSLVVSGACRWEVVEFA